MNNSNNGGYESDDGWADLRKARADVQTTHRTFEVDLRENDQEIGYHLTPFDSPALGVNAQIYNGNGGDNSGSNQILSSEPRPEGLTRTDGNVNGELRVETTTVSQSYDAKAAFYRQRREKIETLKMLRNRPEDELFAAIAEDELLYDVFLCNFDYFHGEKHLDIPTSSLQWRIYPHAAAFDLMDFIRNTPLPKCATPITFVEPGILACTAIDEDVNGNKESIDRIVARLEASGTEITAVTEVSYGSVFLWKQIDAEGKAHYYRVVTLSLKDDLLGNDESWSVLCLDDYTTPGGERIFVVFSKELLKLPDECSMKMLPPLVFLAKLRGLQEIKEGYIEDARNDLHVLLSQKAVEMGIVFRADKDEQATLPAIDLLYVNEEMEIRDDAFLAENLFKCQKQSNGDANKYWMMAGNQLPVIPDRDAAINEILAYLVEDTSTLSVNEERNEDIASDNHITEEVDEEKLPIEPHAEKGSQNDERSMTSSASDDQKFIAILQSFAKEPACLRCITSAFRLCKQTSDVSDEDFNFFISMFTNATGMNS